jgi:hypothetical protein
VIKKVKPQVVSEIKKSAPVDPELRFSFKFFDHMDPEMCPAMFGDGYTQTLMQRLRDLSTWTVRKFTGAPDKTLRNHTHDWTKTARPDGFSRLNAHFKAYEGWQFCLTSNAHGRVHGIIIDDTFHVIWLDQDHSLYPGA